ncbi:pyrroline-5-carboxylate reductase [Pseudomonadota bacterium]
MTTLLLVGCGKMGGAMLEGWLDQGIAATDVTVVEPNQALAQELTLRLGVGTISVADQLPDGYAPDVVVLAVKPQVMGEVLPPYANLSGKPVFLSIAAGKTIQSFETILGSDACVVRAMPNTPAAVGRGITVGCPNALVTDEQEKLCKQLLGAVGEVEWVEDEDLMDAVTAVSGSGPAYIFHLAEAMGHAGRMAGLAPELADKLARVTVAGAGELLHQSSDSAATLRENVTSPGGTTAAALEVLMGQDGLKELMTDAICAATKRSKELAS